VATVEYGPVTPAFFSRKTRPSIFAFDLVRHGRPLWNGGELLSSIPPFGVEAIPPDDALELVMNRMIERLLLDEPGGAADVEARAYQDVKMMLDLAGAALAGVGRYVSKYRSRPAAFRRLLRNDPELRATLGDASAFADELERAARCKLHPAREDLVDGKAAARARSVSRWTLAIWTWLMRHRLHRPRAPLGDLVEGYLRSEPVARRLKAWAKFLLHPLRPASKLDVGRVLRWLPAASPRALTYGAAVLAFAARQGQEGDWRARASALLPFARPRGSAPTVSDIGDVWRWYIRNE
jgi:hypothetical protein